MSRDMTIAMWRIIKPKRLGKPSKQLIASIKYCNLIYPITVRRVKPRKYLRYEILDGLMRFLACKELGWKEIPVRIISCKTV